MDGLDRVTIASRVFGIAAVLGLALLSGDGEVLFSLLVVVTVSTTAAYVAVVTPLPGIWIVTVEALIAGLVIGAAHPGGVILLPYLVVLSLIAGMTRGVVGVVTVITAELAATVAAPLLFDQVVGLEAGPEAFAPWLLTSFGAGLLGAWLKEIGKTPRPTSDRSYESARRLLTQLRTVARRLSAGLDPVSIASQMLDSVGEHLEEVRSAVFVSVDGGTLTPLTHHGEAAHELQPHGHVVDTCWAEMEPRQAPIPGEGASGAHLVALPLRVGARMIGVVVVETVRAAESATAGSLIMCELDDQSVRLDAALAFEEVRSLATVEERRRLSREIHDGIAQEIASLGYLVDDLAATSESGAQRDKLCELREELTRVVSELRLSIFDLRSEVVSQATLGAALSEYVRSVGAKSDLTVHLTLDEAPTRLRPEVEAELLRIAQEAITNARKHSRARNLWVDCRVRPPSAIVRIRDDGYGLSSGRRDSYGLRIMQERADRIDAQLVIDDGHEPDDRHGTVVTVSLGGETAVPSQLEVDR